MQHGEDSQTQNGSPAGDIFDNLDALRLTPEEIAEERAAKAAARTAARRNRKRKEEFFFINCPMAQYRLVARLSAQAVLVWQMIHHRTHVKRRAEVTLPNEMLADLGVNRWGKQRALRDLERVGLVRVKRTTGRAPLIELVALPEDEP
jgi:hypothetical protein